MREKKETNLKYATTLLTALIGLLSVVITAILGYFNTIKVAQIPIQATQTAEARKTEFSLIGTFTPSPSPTLTLTPVGNIKTSVPQNLETQVVELQNQVATLEYMVTQQPSNHDYGSEITSLTKAQGYLDDRLAVIEQAVLDNPGKSLELTLMRKEIDAIKETYKSDSERTLKEIERVYNQNNWFIGLMFSMAIGLISLAVGNFIKRPEKSDENKRENTQKKS